MRREYGPRTKAELKEELAKTVAAANKNGVEVQGGYSLRHDDASTPDWELQLVRLQKPSEETE